MSSLAAGSLAKHREPRFAPFPCRSLARVVSLAMLLGLVLPIACSRGGTDRLEEVRTLQDVGQFAESIPMLRTILAANPDDPEANYRLGLALLRTGQPAEAVWPLQRAAASEDFTKVAGLLLGSLFMQLDDYRQAREAADRVLASEPQLPAALRLRARADLALHQEEEVLRDIAPILEKDPDDYDALVIRATALSDLGRLDEAEAAWKRAFQVSGASGQEALAGKGCVALASFYRDYRKDVEQAERRFRACVKSHPSDPFVLQQTIRFFDDQGRHDDAVALLRKAVEDHPSSLGLRRALASEFERLERPDDAEKTLRKAAEELGTPQAWVELAQYLRRHHKLEEARQALDRTAQAAGAETDDLRFLRADLLVDLGEAEQALALARKIEKPEYRDLVEGRAQLALGRPKEALASLEKGLKLWPNNPGARFEAGRAALELGDVKRAISHFREAARTGAKQTEAALALAHLYLERGDPKQAAAFARMYIGQHPDPRPEGFELWARALARAGNVKAARKAIEKMREEGVPEPRLVLAQAVVEKAGGGPQASLRAIEASGLDLKAPENEPLLRAALDDLLSLGRSDEALRRIDAAIAERPDSASLHEMRGIVLARRGDFAGARAELEKALAREPDRASAISALATVEAREGHMEEAIRDFDRAASLAPRDPAPAYSAAQLLLMQGQRKEAERRLRDLVRRFPGHLGSRNDLALLLAEDKRDLDLALRLAEEARRIEPRPEVLDTLGFVLLQRGQTQGALEVLEQAAKASDSPTIAYHLGLAQARAGQADRARATLRRALAAGSFPEASEARAELARLETGGEGVQR